MRSSNKGKTKQKSKLQTACLLGNIWFSKDDSKHKSVSLQCLLSFLLKQTSIKSSTAVSIHLNLFSHSFFSQSNSNPPKFGQITQGEQKCDVCHNPDLFYSVSHNCIAPRNYDWYDIKIESHLCCPINFWLIWIRQKQKKKSNWPTQIPSILNICSLGGIRLWDTLYEARSQKVWHSVIILWKMTSNLLPTSLH